LNVFKGLHKNAIFIAVIVITVALQILIVEQGSLFTKTGPLTAPQWAITILLGALALPVGFLMRFIPVKEDPRNFASPPLFREL